MRRAAPIVALALWASLVPGARGQVLHEYVPDIGDSYESSLIGVAGREPTAIVQDGVVVPAPAGGGLLPDERAAVANPELSGQPGPGDATYRPDRTTSLEGTLGYHAVFSPSITPFKRVVALDRVVERADGTPILTIAPGASSPVAVAGTSPPGSDSRDRFWGSVVVDFSAGARVPLPSVSPESRVLTLRAEPEVSLRLERDGADNLYVVADSSMRGRVRLVYLMDAPRYYFGTRIPEVASDAFAEYVPSMPARPRRHGLRFARELGLAPGDDLPRVLGVLAEHFRAFEEADTPPFDTGDIYLDLARGQRGVCRHRAYAFVITAQALGIPARFVRNEAHAWAEVMLPSVGWMRVDLGGAAAGLEAHGAEGRPAYRPRESDPLPQPRAYRQGYSSRPAGGEGESGSEGEGEGGGGGRVRQADGQPGSSSGETDGGPAAPGELRVIVDRRHHDVFRGRGIGVGGRVVDDAGAGVPGLRVEVLLSGDRELLLGVTVTGRRGRFDTSLGIPPDVPVGDYRLLVRTPGDAEHGPAVAD